jgi:alanine racemase
MFFRPTRLLVNLNALEANFKRIRAIAGRDCAVCAVVKANAYGMGAVAFAKKLSELGCDYFGVATLKEAAELRSAGITTPIIMLGAVYGKDSLWEALLLDLEISIHHMAEMDDLGRLDEEERRKLRFHLKVNTGMGRLGLQPEEIVPWCKRAKELGISLKGVFTTFASSDQKDNPRTLEQYSLFTRIIESLHEEGFEPPVRHAANSGAILNFPQTLLTMVRPGLLLHGVPSYPGSSPEGFHQVARLESEIVQVAEFPAGSPFGYSSAHRVERQTRAAVLPIGYADGLSRGLGNNCDVLIHGKRAPLIGKVSMDLAIIDVTDIEGVKLGDVATLIGRNGNDEITPWEMAKRIDTIPWEVFCWIGPRVSRVYVQEEL